MSENSQDGVERIYIELTTLSSSLHCEMANYTK